MKRVLEIEGEPIVGKYYLVPCVKAFGKVRPVVGTEHEDKEHIGFERLHYHFDVRFLTESVIQGFVASTPNNYVEIFSDAQLAMIRVSVESKYIGERKMLCKRKMPVFPIASNGILKAKWFPVLEDAYKDTTLNCARCPHRGIPLSEENADENGVVVCCGHGLAWDMKTGRLVSRLK